jgi:hypothetical protein
MGTKMYNNFPKFLKEIDNYKAFKKELNYFFFFILFAQWKNFVSSSQFTNGMY